MQESLQLSCEALSEEVASLESTAEKLARNQHVRCIKTARLDFFPHGFDKLNYTRPKSIKLRDLDIFLCIQELVAAKKARINQLSAIEENSSRLCEAKEQLEVWLRENEHKAANLQGELTPEEVIVASDALARQAIDAQV